ncbi:nucleolar protein 4 isoform X2 [Wyeomyia smithii]|uniref:nucleolar protein 4 isoform X2 n=1 Tax=Wyeomyia smithii TaxID=174621 RepID=UPI0024680CE1|nr:nucleolar protein 4 isoform X2 [Wyeomyia smithii]
MEPHGRSNTFGANRDGNNIALRRTQSAEVVTHTDENRPDSSSSAVFGENVLENFTLQTNFHRQQQERQKRKRKESSFSSCSSSSSASLLSLAPSSERTLFSVNGRTGVTVGGSGVGVGEENLSVGGGSVEQSTRQKSEKLLGLFRTADLNESSWCGKRAQGNNNNNRSARQQQDEPDSPQRKRPKYDYTRDQMFEIFQPWVIQTYGDRAKTKTITLKKQARIIKTLKGLEMNNPDSSKFRFWVKTKGFTTTKPKGFQDIFIYRDQEENDGCSLYAPNSTETGTQPFKRVAVVENFFNIIYGVHVSLGSRSNRHAGQKRTYRTITETYAFLPREAVTKFLSLCSQCSKAMRPQSPAQSEELPSLNRRLSVASKTEPLELDNSVVTRANKRSEVESTHSHSVTEVSSSFDSLGEDVMYSKLLNFCKVQSNVGRDGSDSTYYHLLKTFYENAKQTEKEQNQKERVGLTQSKEETVVDLTEISDSDVSSALQTLKVPNRERVESCMTVECEKSATEAVTQVPIDDDDSMKNQSSNKLLICESFDGGDETARLNETLGDNAGDSDSDSDSDGDDDYNKEANQSRPITSTYLELTRSMGVTDDDALNMDSIPMPFNSEPTENNGTNVGAAGEDAYAGLIKDADKFKLMLLAWNYQNSAAAQNGSEGPDLATMTNLWQQYQNALAMNAKTSFNQLPITERQQPSPIEQQDETNSSEQKDDDELSEDDSEDRIEATVNDPERLKAFNMFVRLFVDENLDRIIPISKQPKEKIQAIIDSCTRQFPEFAERARKRIRTYLKSCRRNKKTREGWENTVSESRPTPAHLTSVQAEQILALACENESLNAKRMRIGLEPISQSVNQTTAVSFMTSEPPNVPTLYQNMNMKCETDTVPAVKTEPVPKMSPIQNTTPDINQMKLNIPSASASSTPTIPTTVPTISNFHDYNTGFQNRSQHYQNFMNSVSSSNSTTTTMSATGTAPTDLSMKRPILAHKLNSAEITAVKQLVTGYRESAAFLMRSADELENLLLQQQ